MLEAEYVDCHSHIYSPQYTNDQIGQILTNAQQSGVKVIINVSERVSHAQQMLSLEQQFPILKTCVGAHPVMGETCVTREEADMTVAFIREHSKQIVGIGECGLDFLPRWATEEAKEVQRYALEEQVKVAREFDFSLNVHSRSAGAPTIEFLQKLNAKNVLLHAFDGRSAVAQKAVESGWYFSVPPSFKRDPRDKWLKKIPLSQICLETDSPCLAPVKGQVNEPMNVKISCEEIARVHGVSTREVALITTQNAKILFPKAFQ